MKTMSPAVTRLSSRSMSRSTPALPVMPGRELAVRVSSADIFMAPILSRNGSGRVEARRNIRPRSTFCNICNTALALVRLEQLDEVSGGIQHEGLPAAPAGDRVTAEADAGRRQRGHGGVQIFHQYLKPVPAARFRRGTIGQRLPGAAAATWRVQQ